MSDQPRPQTRVNPLLVNAACAGAGIILIVLAAGAVDWRLGALIAGVVLVAIALDLPSRSRP